MYACVLPVANARRNSPYRKVIGREVASQEYILSFSKTKGGVSYTVGSPAGGRGFFVHPPSTGRRHPPLEVLDEKLDAADQRRRRLMGQKVERARAMAVKRRPASPKVFEVAETAEVVPEVANGAALLEAAEIPLWEDKGHLEDKREKKAKKTSLKKSDRALWHRVSVFFGGRKEPPTLSDDSRLENADVCNGVLREKPETMSLPDQSSANSPRCRRRSSKSRSKSKDEARLKKKKSSLATT